MSGRRFVVTCIVAFLVSQGFAIVIHGYLLNADYEPFRGTLLRSMDAGSGWQVLFLPVAHLSFIVAFVWVFTRTALRGSWLRQGLQFGLVAWLMAQVPLWLLWYAEQPWPGNLVAKQLVLELVASLTIGTVVSALCRRRSMLTDRDTRVLAEMP